MLKVSDGQKGSVTILAILTVVFLGVVITALLPMLMQEVKTSVLDRDMLEARYAAEAATKRARLNMLSDTPDWTWLDRPCSYGPDDTKTYTVRNNGIFDVTNNQQYIPEAPVPSNNEYTVTAAVKVGNVTKNITLRFVAP